MFQVDWNTMRKIYGDGDPNLPMIGRERTCLFQWSTNLEKVTHNYIKPSLQFQQKKVKG